MNNLQIAQNKAEALNVMHTYINALVPKLNAYLEANEIKTKVDGSLFAKNKEAINAIIQVDKPANLRCWFKVSEHSGCSIQFDITHKTGDYGCAYNKGWMPLQCEVEQLPTAYTGIHIVQIEKAIEERKTRIRALEHEISKAKNSIYL